MISRNFVVSIHTVSFADLICDCLSNFLAVWLIRVLIQHSGKLIAANLVQSLGCTDSFFLIQAQIQRSVCTEGKTALRVIDLHR